MQIIGNIRYIYIDQSVIDKKFRIILKSISESYCFGHCYFVSKDGKEEEFVGGYYPNSLDATFTIPQDTVKLKFSFQRNFGIYEIKLVD
ncbi:MAG: hypothetical protein HFJ58_02045 [Clostridia bacterium]|nr:hypothetical protein [Clostridia bacterium]